jgi:hypothetical protein
MQGLFSLTRPFPPSGLRVSNVTFYRPANFSWADDAASVRSLFGSGPFGASGLTHSYRDVSVAYDLDDSLVAVPLLPVLYDQWFAQLSAEQKGPLEDDRRWHERYVVINGRRTTMGLDTSGKMLGVSSFGFPTHLFVYGVDLVGQSCRGGNMLDGRRLVTDFARFVGEQDLDSLVGPAASLVAEVSRQYDVPSSVRAFYDGR